MANTDAFALPHSDLNGFLFAEIGEESGGLALSVMSALARKGVDPWQEGARLARLPLAGAVDELARMIAAMPASLWPLPVATEIAARLVRLLPGREAGGSAAVPGSAGSGLFSRSGTAKLGFNKEWVTLILMGLAILVGSAVGLSRQAPEAPAIPAVSAPPLSSVPLSSTPVSSVPAQPPAPPGGD